MTVRQSEAAATALGRDFFFEVRPWLAALCLRRIAPGDKRLKYSLN
jgi:hypothetical protein